jgi:hypothetical protein
MATIGYRSGDVTPSVSWKWTRIAWAVTLLDLIAAFYVATHTMFDPQYGVLHGFNGWARPVVFVSSLFNVIAFMLVLGVFFTESGYRRWVLLPAFLVHAYVALNFFPIRFGI